jgi:chloramphenicol 3-O-phosphotransferase
MPSEPAGKLIIISGPIGAGKTAVAQELVDKMKGDVVYIEGDTFWSHIKSRADASDFRSSFRTIMRAMTAAAIAYAATGSDAVLDFSIPPEYLPGVKKLVGSREIEVRFIIIKPSIEVCAQRAATRREGKFVNYDEVAEFYARFAGQPEYAIEDDNADVKSLAAKIYAGLAAGEYRVS